MSCNSCEHLELNCENIWYCELTELTTSHCDWCDRYEAAYKSRDSDRERIWCFEHQERCEGPETECKFLKDGDFCKLFDKTIIKHKKRST